MKRVKINEQFYGWKAGTTEIDERGNTSIEVCCDTVESVSDEISLLIESERNKKRGYLKTLHFIVDNIEFLVTGNKEKKYDLLVLYTDKPYSSTVQKEKLDIEQALMHIKNVLKII